MLARQTELRSTACVWCAIPRRQLLGEIFGPVDRRATPVAVSRSGHHAGDHRVIEGWIRQYPSNGCGCTAAGGDERTFPSMNAPYYLLRIIAQFHRVRMRLKISRHRRRRRSVAGRGNGQWPRHGFAFRSGRRKVLVEQARLRRGTSHGAAVGGECARSKRTLQGVDARGNGRRRTAALGRIDVLHYNVGVSLAGGDAVLAEFTEAAFDRIATSTCRRIMAASMSCR